MTSLRENTQFKADVIVYDREAAKIEAQTPPPGTDFMDRQHPTRQRGMRVLGCLGKGPHDWRGVKTNMGTNREAYGAEWAAIVRVLDLRR